MRDARRENLGCIATLILWAIAFVAITAVDVDAAPPGDRCDACRLGTPRPTPIVVGITPAPAPSSTVILLPNTDAAP